MWTKETKKQLRTRIEDLHRPVIVASDKESLARLHADILANRPVHESAGKYVDAVKRLAGLLKIDEDGTREPFPSHSDVIKNTRTAGATLNQETGKWRKS